MTARRSAGPRAVKFIEEHCVHPDGPLVGQPFLVHPWWRRTIYELLEVAPDASGTVRRKHSEAYISVGKKNSKTACLAALGLYFLLADGDPSSFVVSAAASEEQGANLLYGAAKIMCQLSPSLKALTIAMDKEIQVPSLPRARMRNVTSKAGTNDGLHCRAVLLDELHEWKGQRGKDMYHVLAGSLGARRDSIMVAITTAGYDQDSICFNRYEYAKGVLDGTIDDARFYARIAEAPEDCDYRDPRSWAIANPLLGVSVFPEYIEARVKREPESVVRRYNLNQWVAASELWIGYGDWDRCYSPELELSPDEPLYVGLDLSRNIDSSAAAMVQRREIDGQTRYIARCRIWKNPYRPDEERYQTWRMNLHDVAALIGELRERFPVPAATIDDVIFTGPAICYDPWRFRTEADTLAGDGVAMVEWPQTDTRMIPASQALREAIVSGQLAHDGDMELKRQVHNVVAEQRERGWRISKVKGSGRMIDAAVALAIAVSASQTIERPGDGRSVYESKGLLVL